MYGFNNDGDDVAEFCRQIVGQNETVASVLVACAGGTVRVMQRDGVAFVGTCDFVPNRINLTIVGDKVTAAHVG